MFGFIKSLFSSENSAGTTILKGVGNFIDEQQFTKEEKSKANLLLLDYNLKWINATKGMNLARRYIAIMFVVSFLFTFLLCILTAFISFIFNIDASGFIDIIVKITETFKIGYIVITVIVFYFGKGIYENSQGKKKAT